MSSPSLPLPTLSELPAAEWAVAAGATTSLSDARCLPLRLVLHLFLLHHLLLLTRLLLLRLLRPFLRLRLFHRFLLLQTVWCPGQHVLVRDAVSVCIFFTAIGSLVGH